MTLKIFSVLDTKADAFMPPFFFSTVGQAVRAFKELANDASSSPGRHPNDFRLYCIGTFDDATAAIRPLEQVEPLGYAADYKDLPGTPIGVKAIP